MGRKSEGWALEAASSDMVVMDNEHMMVEEGQVSSFLRSTFDLDTHKMVCWGSYSVLVPRA
jgi:hypothetical protein